MNRIAVIGGSLAGIHAAETLRDRGYEGELTVVSADEELPYDRPPLSKDLLLGRTAPELLPLRAESWYAERDILLRRGVAARGLDTVAGIVALSDGTELAYDGLVVATGSVARELPADAATHAAHVVRTLPDALGLVPELREGRHLVVVGGGFIGLEIAGVARHLGLEVTLVERSSKPLLRTFGDEAASWYRELHERNGVRLICSREIASLGASAGGTALHLDDGTVVNADVVVAGVGARPAVDWLAGSAVVVEDGVRCASDLQTSVPHVVAAGDVARWRNPIFDEDMRVEHWSNAIDQGRHAAATLMGEREGFGSVPYFWTDQHETKMRFVGRSVGATERRVEELTEDKLVVTYGRDERLIGALCVNAPRAMAKYRVAIQDRSPWREVAAVA